MNVDEVVPCIVDGAAVIAGAVGGVLDPATELPIANYAVADVATLDAAVAAGRRAFAGWRATEVRHRQRALRALARALDADAERIAKLLTAEQGKPLDEARGEVGASVALFDWCADHPIADEAALFRDVATDHERLYTPLGVVAGIVPWNFPLLIAAMKLGPSLLTGNVIVLKPAPTTPLATAALVRLAGEVLPPGVVQLVLDDGSIGPRLVRHPGVDKVCFTGSTPTGRDVMRGAAESLKRVTLELGGNDAAIVLDDVEPGEVAGGLLAAAFANAGQVCGAVKRVYVHARIHDALCDALREQVRRIVVGPGLRPGVQIGPLQNAMQYRKARDLEADATRRGRLLGAAACSESRGYFVAPSVFVGLADSDRLVAEEQFAPLLPVLRFDDDADAIARANGTPFGLTASVWGADRERARRVAAGLNAGLVCINKHNDSPFDGAIVPAKSSGIGWMFGVEGLKEYLQPHYLTW